MDGKIIIEELIAYAKYHLHLKEDDIIYKRNYLLYILNLNSPYKGVINEEDIKKLTRPDLLIEKLKTYILENNLVEQEYLEIFITNILGELTPLPSVINEEFKNIILTKGPNEACKFIFDLSIKNGYIQKTAIEKNLMWKYKPLNSDKYLEITINLSKPEKNNKDTAKLLTAKQIDKYPACLLCKDNIGFSGTLTHPARRSIRTINLTLDDEKWFMQYSPYAYYNEHCIIINENHHPMRIDHSTPKKLLDFVDYLPNYFIGSNAPLPIVGGSILNHEHFQGGEHLMPMHNAKIKEYFKTKYDDLSFGILDWYNSALQFESANKNTIIEVINKVIDTWTNYDNKTCDIVSFTNDIPHNTVSPICRKVGNKYIFTLILRNNNTSEKYPDGIFHVHEEYQNIKHESIGLIEAMGLFILPGRLKRQLDNIEDILCKNVSYDEESINNENNDLFVHRFMIKDLLKNGYVKTKDEAHQIVINYVNQVCEKILENTAVFKNDEIGRKGLIDFIKKCNL